MLSQALHGLLLVLLQEEAAPILAKLLHLLGRVPLVEHDHRLGQWALLRLLQLLLQHRIAITLIEPSGLLRRIQRGIGLSLVARR